MNKKKCEAKGKEKRKKYLTRFVGINTAELCCPSYGRSGSRSEEAVTLQKRITTALASVDSTTPYSLVATRVSQVISVALQRAVAYNALDFRYTKLGQSRAVGGGAVPVGAGAGGPVAAQVANDWEADDDEPVRAGEGL